MKRTIAVIGILVSLFFAYANLSQVNTRRDYIEACLYIMNTDQQKDNCYNVYPENHSRDAIILGIASLIGAVIFIGMFISSKSHQQEDHSKSSKLIE